MATDDHARAGLLGMAYGASAPQCWNRLPTELSVSAPVGRCACVLPSEVRRRSSCLGIEARYRGRPVLAREIAWCAEPPKIFIRRDTWGRATRPRSTPPGLRLTTRNAEPGHYRVRIILIAPIAVLANILSATAVSTVTVLAESGQIINQASRTGGGVAGALFLATLLMIVLRQGYPRW